MINSLTIQNFLSHEESVIEFSSGVNIIVGPSDSGKSAIIKAIKWVVFNRPMGDGMRSKWGGDTTVSMIVGGEFGPVVRRTKTKDHNGYFVEDVKFSAVKGDIPAEVFKVLDLTEINLQTQFDPHFLLSNSSGEVAQYFNRVAHLDKIDTGLQNIQRWTREIQKKISYDEEALNRDKERLIAFDCLDSIEDSLISLEEKQNVRERKEKASTSLLKIVADIQAVDEKIEEMEFLQELEVTVGNLLALYNKKKQAKMASDSLQQLVLQIQTIEVKISTVEESIKDYEEEFHEALGKGSVCPLCGSLIK